MLKSFAGILVVFLVLIASAFSSFADCTSNCKAFYDPTNPTAWDSLGIQVGQPAVNFFLLGTDGKAVNLSKLWADKPLFLEFGAYTWGPFRQRVAATNALYDEYNDKVNFVQIYVIEPHPYGVTSPYGPYATFPGYWASLDIEGNPLHQPTSFAERFNQAQHEQKELGVKIPMIVDEMNNPVWCTYGPLPNCAYLIGSWWHGPWKRNLVSAGENGSSN